MLDIVARLKEIGNPYATLDKLQMTATADERRVLNIVLADACRKGLIRKNSSKDKIVTYWLPEHDGAMNRLGLFAQGSSHTMLATPEVKTKNRFSENDLQEAVKEFKSEPTLIPPVGVKKPPALTEYLKSINSEKAAASLDSTKPVAPFSIPANPVDNKDVNAGYDVQVSNNANPIADKFKVASEARQKAVLQRRADRKAATIERNALKLQKKAAAKIANKALREAHKDKVSLSPDAVLTIVGKPIFTSIKPTESIVEEQKDRQHTETGSIANLILNFDEAARFHLSMSKGKLTLISPDLLIVLNKQTTEDLKTYFRNNNG